MGPKSLSSSNSPWESRVTHNNPSTISPPSEIGISRLGNLRFTRTQFTCKTKPRTLMVSGSTFFPYREIDGCGVARLMQRKPPNPESPTACHLSSTCSGGPTQLRHLLRSCDRGSRDRDFTGYNSLASQNPEPRFSDATCQRLLGRPTSRHLSPSHSIGIS